MQGQPKNTAERGFRGSRAPTVRQLEVLRTVSGLARTNGVPPTIREIGDRLGLSSTNGIRQHLEALQGRGLIQWQPQKSRTLRVTAAGQKMLREAR
jgi:repressor LexA